ncbi:hypothetical protein CCUS01_00442 [Colletotrichum cuscutae]|uniref:Uncharacterized protein n=1 Tax=Colletotrichum cuscutae TaxID=1209917 RepID=A0AAI9VAE1_9PEZI|nr:hypothetical protein CCUS01_00442 [Colletotrichum cuscutae]
MLRHHIPTQVATPRCWPVRMPGLEPLSASRFVQPLLLTVARRTPTLTWHAQFLLPATRKFNLFLQLYYCMLGFARSRDESAQDNSSSKQQARPFQPTPYPLESLRKSMAREDGENREMDGDLTERGRKGKAGIAVNLQPATSTTIPLTRKTEKWRYFQLFNSPTANAQQTF